MQGKEEDKEFYVPGLMDLTSYNMVRADLDAKWDKFVLDSPQGSIFATSAFLRGTGYKIAAWYCFKGNQLKGAFCAIESGDGESCIAAGHAIHGGIMFVPAYPEQNIAQVYSEEFRVTSAITKEIANIYKNIHFTNHPSLVDIRPILWHNYGKDGDKFHANIRYTSLLELPSADIIHDFQKSPLYKQCNTSRRQEIRYGMQEGLITEIDHKADNFLDLYVKTFQRQNMEVPQHEIEILKNIMANLYKEGKLRTFATYTKERQLGSIAVFGIQNKIAYYLYGANNPELRDCHCGTTVLWDGFKFLAEEDLRQVDLEGINSPKRGYFKLSFGGSITPYYQISLTRN